MNGLAKCLVAGASAGLVATAAMTVAMEAMFRLLPRWQRFPLPPRYLTVRLAARAGVAETMDEPARYRATLLSHFAYGTGAGAGYALLARRLPLPSPIGGILYGLVVYVVGYVGWLPALGLYQPPTRETAARDALLVASHVVWGATLALVVERRLG